jgi:hypothetical protein
VRPSPAPWHVQTDLNSIAWPGMDSSQVSNVDTLSAQAVRVVSNEMLLNRGIKESGWRSQGDATASFLSICRGKATGTWQACLWCLLLAPAALLIYHRRLRFFLRSPFVKRSIYEEISRIPPKRARLDTRGASPPEDLACSRG